MKQNSENIFDLDDDCGDIISMEDIRRNSEEKRRKKLTEAN